MVAKTRRKRLTLPAATLPVAPLAGALAGGAAALFFALVPGTMLDRLVMASGLPAIIEAAQPPLQFNARLLLALVGGGTGALLGWFAIFVTIGSRTIGFGPTADAGEEPVPVLRRADAHPDAPARRPVFANRDLGTPFLEVRAPKPEPSVVPESVPEPLPEPFSEIGPDAPRPLPLRRLPMNLPDDLDQPMAAFDPDSFRSPPFRRPSPREESSPIPIRRPVFEPGERMETFDLPTPMPVMDQPPAAPRPPREPRDTQATITALLERLEQGVTHRAERSVARTDGLQDTLGTLRRMATRG